MLINQFIYFYLAINKICFSLYVSVFFICSFLLIITHFNDIVLFNFNFFIYFIYEIRYETYFIYIFYQEPTPPSTGILLLIHHHLKMLHYLLQMMLHLSQPFLFFQLFRVVIAPNAIAEGTSPVYHSGFSISILLNFFIHNLDIP